MMRCKVCGKEYSGWGRYSKDCCSRECAERARQTFGGATRSTPVLIVIPRALYLSAGMNPEIGSIYKAEKIGNVDGNGFHYRLTVRGSPLLLKESDCWEVELNVMCAEEHGIRPKPGWDNAVISKFLCSGFGK